MTEKAMNTNAPPATASIKYICGCWCGCKATMTGPTYRCLTCEKTCDASSSAGTALHESPVHAWFGLSYASWLTLPRILMEAMPHDWQERMVALLREMEEEFIEDPSYEHTRVMCVAYGKLVKTPPELINYRRPDKAYVDRLRRTKVGLGESE